MLSRKEMARGIDGNQWTLGAANNISMEQLCTWAKVDGRNSDGDPTSGAGWYEDFEEELWFDLGKSMLRKHRSVFEDHAKYIRNGILKTYMVGIHQCAEKVREIHDLAKFLTPPLE